MATTGAVRHTSILLVEDDDDDYLLTRDLVERLTGGTYELARASDFDGGLRAAQEASYDVCLVDYRLGARNGIDLVRELTSDGSDVPVIVLTGQGDYAVDVEAAEAGASDYLVKGEITPDVLERTLRYAVQTHAHLKALRKHEEGLRQAQRMEAVGRLAGGVAHDFNNLLLVIRGYSALMLSAELDDTLREHVTQIDRAANQAADLTRQLLAYSRQQILQVQTADLNLIVSDTLTMLRRLIGEDVEVHATYAESLPSVIVDRGQVSQVILNLAINARDAMPGGGVLAVRTDLVELDEHYAADHPDVTAGQYVVLELTDSGIGMDEETRRRVFDPYFTTKETGNGLGLATVYGIVRQSNGHVSLYSEPGIGTTFKVYLPCAQTTTGSLPKPYEPHTLEGNETVLVVEDAEQVRNLVTRVLESFGYTVIAASSGDEALGLVQGGLQVDLVFTDVVMPGMNGRELVEHVERLQPEAKILFSSGYPADTIIRQGIAAARVAFIQKPYVAIDLAQRVRAVLDGR